MFSSSLVLITPLSSLFSPVDFIRNGIDILVGTPGRIKDHIQNNKLDLTKLKHVVLDEVDQMLDMGFAEQVEEILALSYKKGTILSAVKIKFVSANNCFFYDVKDKIEIGSNLSFPLMCFCFFFFRW